MRSLPSHLRDKPDSTLGLYIPDSIRAWLLSGAPRIYDRKDLDLPGNRQLALPSILTRYFCSELTIHQFESLLNARQAEDDKELDAAATECRRMKRAKQTLPRLPHPAASSTTTSAPLAPAPLGNTPPPSPRIPDTGRGRTPPPERPRPIGMHPGPPHCHRGGYPSQEDSVGIVRIPKSWSETYTENAPMPSGWSEPALWSLDIFFFP